MLCSYVLWECIRKRRVSITFKANQARMDGRGGLCGDEKKKAQRHRSSTFRFPWGEAKSEPKQRPTLAAPTYSHLVIHTVLIFPFTASGYPLHQEANRHLGNVQRGAFRAKIRLRGKSLGPLCRERMQMLKVGRRLASFAIIQVVER